MFCVSIGGIREERTDETIKTSRTTHCEIGTTITNHFEGEQWASNQGQFGVIL